MVQKVLKKLREKHNLAQQMMANILGIPYISYRHYEYGQRKIPIILSHRIKKCFGVSIPTRRCSDLLYNRVESGSSLIYKNGLAIGHRLKKIRQQKKIPAKWIAYKTDVSYAYYKKIENNIKIPPRTFYTKFCQMLRIPINALRKK